MNDVTIYVTSPLIFFFSIQEELDQIVANLVGSWHFLRFRSRRKIREFKPIMTSRRRGHRLSLARSVFLFLSFSLERLLPAR